MALNLIERLESRRLFALAVNVDVADSDGSPFAHLTKTGTLVLSGQLQGDTLTVETSTTGKRILAIGPGPLIGNFSAKEVKRVLVAGGGGQDKLISNNCNKPVTLVGGSGNDILQGGYRSTLISGDGNDKLIVTAPDRNSGFRNFDGSVRFVSRDAAGRFEIVTSDGSTVIYDHAGAGVVSFVAGPSLLSGGAGNDTFATGGSEDSVIGGAGTDEFTPSGKLTITIGSGDVEGIGELSGVERIVTAP